MKLTIELRRFGFMVQLWDFDAYSAVFVFASIALHARRHYFGWKIFRSSHCGAGIALWFDGQRDEFFLQPPIRHLRSL